MPLEPVEKGFSFSHITKKKTSILFLIGFILAFLLSACSLPDASVGKDNQDGTATDANAAVVFDYPIDDLSEELHVAVMCDVHVPYAAMDKKHMFASKKQNKKKSKEYKNTKDGTQAKVYAAALSETVKEGYDTVLVVGDLTAESKQSEYDLYNKTIKPYKDSLNIIESMGNHELRSKKANERAKMRKRWTKNMGTEIYFDENIEGAHVWALGSDSDGKKSIPRSRGFISKKQLDWLEAGLDADYKNGVTSIVMCHWPADDTYPVTSASNKKTSSKQSRSFSNKKLADRLRNIIISHPNAVMFSGHTHASILRDGQLTICQPKEGGGLFVHAGVIFSKSPKWVEIDEKETVNSDDGTIAKTYEIRYAGLKGKTKHMFSWTWKKPVLQPS